MDGNAMTLFVIHSGRYEDGKQVSEFKQDTDVGDFITKNLAMNYGFEFFVIEGNKVEFLPQQVAIKYGRAP
jgi:hypothetical protein